MMAQYAEESASQDLSSHALALTTATSGTPASADTQTRDREQRLQAARRKLKTFRAKQAKLARTPAGAPAPSATSVAHARSHSRSHSRKLSSSSSSASAFASSSSLYHLAGAGGPPVSPSASRRSGAGARASSARGASISSVASSSAHSAHSGHSSVSAAGSSASSATLHSRRSAAAAAAADEQAHAFALAAEPRAYAFANASAQAQAAAAHRRSIVAAALKHDAQQQQQASAVAQDAGSAQAGGHMRRHSRAPSTSGGPPPSASARGHGRGHSRTSSISIALKPVSPSVPDAGAQARAHAHSPMQGHAPRQPSISASVASAAGVSSVVVPASPSPAAAAAAPAPEEERRAAKRRSVAFAPPPAAASASAPAAHARTHSRAHSRSASRSSSAAFGARPRSIMLLGGLPSAAGPAPILAVEHGPDITAASFAPANRDAWADEPEQQSQPEAAQAEAQEEDRDMLTPSASGALGAAEEGAQHKHRLSAASLASAQSITPLASPARAPSAALAPEPSSSPAGVAQFAPAPAAGAATSAAAKRLSRHNRRASVATRRESMEIMGGLFHGPAAQAAGVTGYSPAERRRSAIASKRFSGLLPASTLFGGAPDVAFAPAASDQQQQQQARASGATARSTARASVQRDWNWQSVFGSGAADAETDSRLSALEKLEGRATGTPTSPEEREAQDATAGKKQAPEPYPLVVPESITHRSSNTQVPLVTLQGNTPTPGPNTAAANKQFMPGTLDSARPSSTSFAGGLRPPPVLFEPDMSDDDERDASSSTAASSSSPVSACVDQRGSRSSVQLPDFEDLHGESGMDKRASLSLLEKNEQTTSADNSLRASASSAGPTVTAFAMRDAVDSLSSSAMASPKSFIRSPKSSPRALPPSSPSPSGALRPATSPMTPTASEDSVASNSEGLGTLLEEEEDDESEGGPLSPPLSSAVALNLITAAGSSAQDAAAAARDAAAEDELAQLKKARRACALAPKAMKLKSRPASLYLAPSMRNSSSLVNEWSPAAGSAEFTPAADTSSEAAEEPDTSGELKRGWTMPRAQQPASAAKSSAAAEQLPHVVSPPSAASIEARKRAWRMSMPAAGAPTSASQQRVGMRRLQLGALSSATPSTAESTQSFASDVTSGSSATHAKRRSSITYKSSEGGLPSARSASITGFTFPQSSSGDSISSTATSVAAVNSAVVANAVSPAAWDELKTKAQRDAALLESTRKQLEATQKELAGEKLRAEREHAELEQTLKAETQSLATKLESLEGIAAARASELETAQEETSKLRAEVEKLQSTLEETEAERDMYQDDVDGWRTRCADLEKKLASERTRSETETSSRLRIAAKAKRLMAQLVALNADIAAEDQISEADVAPPSLDRPGHVSRYSPSSPLANSGVGYFGPGAAMPPPEQTVKLLADMRQQIFNLAGTLEHERKEREKTEQELESLRALKAAAEPAQDAAVASEAPHAGSPAENDSLELELEQDVSVVADVPITTVSPTRTRTKRHIFAYDSSASSSQEHSSASLGSQSIGNTTIAEQTADEDAFLKAQASFAAAEGEDDEGDFSLATGRTGLQTLNEEEEDEDHTSQATSGDLAPREEPTLTRPSFDIEGGALDDSFDEEADWEAPPTAVDATSLMHHLPPAVKVPHVALDGSVLELASPRTSEGRRSSTSGKMPGLQHTVRDSDDSSFDSQGPLSPPNGRADDMDDDSDDEEHTEAYGADRPEFVPDWSFHKASEHALRRLMKPSKRSRKHGKMPSVEDFFGILTEATLPPLPTPADALDMPPIRIDLLPQRPQSKTYVPRSVVRSASLRSSPGFSAARYNPYDAPDATNRTSLSGSSEGTRMSTDSTSSYFSRATGLGRASLQGVTSALSGWGGYLKRQDAHVLPVASNAGAPPKQSYAPPPVAPAKHRQSGAPSSVASSASSNMKRYVPRYGHPAPTPTSVAELDFTRITGGAGSHPVFAL